MILALALVAGCGGKAPGAADTAGPGATPGHTGDTGADSGGADSGGADSGGADSGGADSAAVDTAAPGHTGDTGADSGGADSGEPGGEGLLYLEGEAVASAGGYVGREDVLLLAELGLGDALCRIRCDVTSTASRTDCDECLWAFDLTLGPAEVLVDEGGACALAGYDAEAVAALEGATRSYGFIDDYIGHAAVLMHDQGAGWEVAAYATWSPETGAVSYQWEQGYVAY